MRRRAPLAAVVLVGGMTLSAGLRAAELPRDNGYRGVWYMNQPTRDEYRYKYSGGFATYPQQHIPIAVHAPAARKTFFVYGGRPKDRNTLLHLVSYYDHATGEVPRPVVLLDKQTTDAHDNPTLSINDAGYLWVFSNAHGTGRPAFVSRSVRPYDISAFERVLTTNFSYSQPWHLPGHGFLFLHTRYQGGRVLHWQTSRDGRAWDEPHVLARFGEGHYQVSWRDGGRVGTAFDYHPRPGGLNARTNIYYLETRDAGRTWTTAAGRPVAPPLAEVKNLALVRDYQAEQRLVYLKDLQFDADGRPVILYLTTRGYEPGPKNGPRAWHTARWTGAAWEFRDVTASDHNYDHGSLYLEPDGAWRVLAPTDPGPQPHGTGGEVVSWLSRDRGATWARERPLTANSPRNHTYVRRPLDAHPDFRALWADGDPLRPSESRLYFANAAGDVFVLPETMSGETAKPERVPLSTTPRTVR